MTDPDTPITRLNAALEGRYSIERELGEGGMATVYLAEDVKHQRNVALKVLKPELAAVIGGERFLAEIRTTANLQHPHILPLFDSGGTDGFLYYVMPYVEGETLRARIDRERQLGVEESLSLTKSVASALQYAHDQGVIHRDIKPENILVHAGQPVVADFGIALALSAAGAGRLTETGLSLGTPHYMSPEQATADRDLSARSDVYSLGCVLYEMLAGNPPHSGPTAQAILVRILTEEPRSITDARKTVPPHVAAVLSKALEKLPADRFDSAAEFAKALDDPNFTHAQPTRAQPAMASPAAESRASGAAVSRGAFTAVSVIAVAGLILAAWGWLKPSPPLGVMRASLAVPVQDLAPLGEVLISPDGSKLAVVGSASSDPIYWRNANEEEFRPIPGTEEAEFASFSPDGQSLVFGTLTSGSLQRVALSGGAPQIVTLLPEPSIGGVHWGDDGTVVFATQNGRGLNRVPATGGEVEVLIEGAAFHTVRNPHLLRGGRAVIFTDGVASSTLLLDLETDSVRVLRPGALDATYIDSGHLLYTDGSGTLWAAQFDLRTLELTSEPVTVFGGITKPTPHFARYSVSDNGTLVYGSGGASTDNPFGFGLDLVIFDPQSGAEERPLDSQGTFFHRWSPDGRTLAFSGSEERGGLADIFTFDVALGNTPRPVTFEGLNVMPVWSPDGTKVVFGAQRSGTMDLWVKALNDDSPGRVLVELPGGQIPFDWPAEDVLVFQTADPNGLWTLDPTSSDPVPVEYLIAQGLLSSVAVSPNGDFAAYTSEDGGASGVYVRSFPVAGARERISPGLGYFPKWSRDGNSIYYWTGSGLNDLNTLVAARVSHGPPFVVVSSDTVIAGTYSVYIGWDLNRSDGRMAIGQAVDLASEGQERFYVVTNWFEELKERMGGS